MGSYMTRISFLVEEEITYHICIRSKRHMEKPALVTKRGRFEYNASADLVKEVQFEEVEGGVRTRIVRK
ncbi:hypothetical protein SCA6_004699 [Theobroma cacao]